MSAIPTAARKRVKERQNSQCARCGNLYSELHHRQRRRDGGHGDENLVGLCGTDHKWAHANPARAKEHGYIVAPHVDDVSTIPIKTFMGWLLFDKDGDATFVEDN